MFRNLKRKFRDVPSDAPLEIGTRGLVTLPTRGKDGPGEVQLELKGGSAAFIAYSDEPLPVGTQVVAYEVFGGRKVKVEKVG